MTIESIYFFSFFCLIMIFSFKILIISSQALSLDSKRLSKLLPLRRDIVDRNGILISRILA